MGKYLHSHILNYQALRYLFKNQLEDILLKCSIFIYKNGKNLYNHTLNYHALRYILKNQLGQVVKWFVQESDRVQRSLDILKLLNCYDKTLCHSIYLDKKSVASKSALSTNWGTHHRKCGLIYWRKIIFLFYLLFKNQLESNEHWWTCIS